MATEPVDYRLMAALKASLQGISQSSGYFYDLDDQAVKLDPEHGVEEMTAANGPRPCVIVEAQVETWEYHPAGEVLYTLPVIVHWIHAPAPLADAVLGEPVPPQDEDRMRMYYRGVADVEKAIAENSALNAITSGAKITGRRWNPVNGGNDVWAEVDVEFRIYPTYGSPA